MGLVPDAVHPGGEEAGYERATYALGGDEAFTMTDRGVADGELYVDNETPYGDRRQRRNTTTGVPGRALRGINLGARPLFAAASMLSWFDVASPGRAIRPATSSAPAG